MVLMAIDHVRVYAGVPAGGPTPGVFFTRWVTHFCAPAFVFLAGTSAWLYGSRLERRASVASWLLTRGAFLVLLELTVLRLAWTFTFDYGNYLLAGVIWMLGWCMILLGLLVRVPVKAIGIFGVAMIVLHNAIPFLVGSGEEGMLHGAVGWLLKLLYFGGAISLGGGEPNFLVLYVIVPWIGVMAAGYAFGSLLENQGTRRRTCLVIGTSATVLFIVLRALNVYGDWPWGSNPSAPAWIQFLNTTKYPASLLFLLMTLGPTILALGLLEGASGRVVAWLRVFGRVPMFYYLLHIPLIHAVAVLISLVRSPDATGWLFGHHPMNPGLPPAGYRWSLPLLYLVTAFVVVVLYYPCRWYAALKARRKDAWLSYV
jgi:uncharacterized membrane protein